MALQIANPAVIAKIELLAGATGLTKTVAVEKAVDALLEREEAGQNGNIQRRMRAILAQIDRTPDLPAALDPLVGGAWPAAMIAVDASAIALNETNRGSFRLFSLRRVRQGQWPPGGTALRRCVRLCPGQGAEPAAALRRGRFRRDGHLAGLSLTQICERGGLRVRASPIPMSQFRTRRPSAFPLEWVGSGMNRRCP